ncbi:MAG: response regulator transcription factor [Anaerolineae bacterium]|uniref:response regulator transcription factor n=1 Tax=Candidatus Flexifilum breve TaxID=3140694 RepID=UPI001AC84CB5|nr:response regulator transcription factor [Chloroflexota bacterium]MBK9748707.1 response regulator transcription factor [Chloroflexota bacterium]MBN8639176.1 response regulator transcription factor [Anaerolineae bacterium]
MTHPLILLVGEELQVLDIWAYALKRVGYETVCLTSLKAAREWRSENTADLIVLDENTPHKETPLHVQHLRAQAHEPIMWLTPKDYERCLEAYRVGADECCSKPISPELFLAKVQAWLRHSGHPLTAQAQTIKRGEFELFPETLEVRVADRRVTLTTLEFRLLQMLILRADQVVPSNELIKRVWGYEPGLEGAVLKNTIYRLRRKVEPSAADPRHIISVVGEGYLFRP